MHFTILLWAILSLPSIPLLWDFVVAERYFAELMYESGIYSIQLLLLALAITSIQRLARVVPILTKPSRWLLRNRRYFGVASFGYAALHVAFYVRYTEAAYDIAVEALEPRYATGWLAFLVLSLMAATSNNASMRALGPKWKQLQRWIYPGLIALFLHWILFAFFNSEAITYAMAFLAIKLTQFLIGRSPSYKIF